jgi:hypothetical protein
VAPAGSGGYFGSGASGVFVKKDQMTCAALGVLPWGHGKPWPPVFHTANPTLAPLEQSAHVVSVIALCGVTAGDPLHPSTARSAATCTVAGGDSLPLSPGAYGTAVSSRRRSRA